MKPERVFSSPATRQPTQRVGSGESYVQLTEGGNQIAGELGWVVKMPRSPFPITSVRSQAARIRFGKGQSILNMRN